MPRRPIAICAAFALASGATGADAADALGVNVHQSAGVGLDVARDAGLGWVRVDLDWPTVQPTAAPPDYTLLDSVVDGATSRGLQVLAIVGYTPAWASSGDVLGDGSNNDVPAPGLYEAFVTATVQHFQGRVTHFELWNEPNLSVFFEGTANDYVTRILQPGSDAVHAACPACLVVAPATATVGMGYDTWLNEVLGTAQDKIDIVSGHIYASFPDQDPNVGKTSDSFFNKLDDHRLVKFQGQVLYEGPLSFREVMLANGVTKPFWLTETGAEAAYADLAAEATQTLVYRHTLEAMLTRPWWSTTIFYEAFDEPNSGYTWGMALDAPVLPLGYAPKPVMSLLQKVTSAQPLFGGTGTDCDDGLDNDGDGAIDYPADRTCTSAQSTSEGPPGSGGSGGGWGTGGGATGHAATGSGGSGQGGGTHRGSGCACRIHVPPAPDADSGWALLGLVALARRFGRRSGSLSS